MMSPRFSRVATLVPAVVVVATFLGVAPRTAWAEANPYYAGVGISAEHDSNVTRQAKENPNVSSSVYSAVLLAGINQPIGRQRIFGDARLQSTRFDKYRAYDNSGYALTAGVDWSTIERLSGTVRVGATQTLARFAPGEAPAELAKNIERTQDASITARIGVTTPLTMEASLDHRRVRYSSEDFDQREFDQTGGGLGVRYVLGGALTLGAGARHTVLDYSRVAETASGDPISNKLKRDDIDFSATWAASGVSTVVARISATRWRNSLTALSDYRGGTGLITWNWRPTGKLAITTRLSRESGTESSFILRNLGTSSSILGLAGQLIPDQVDGSTLVSALQLQADYEATAKIRLNLAARLQERQLDRTQFAAGARATDRTQSFSFGASWAPIRALSLGCQVRLDSRSASSLVAAYEVDGYGCNAQFVMQ